VADPIRDAKVNGDRFEQVLAEVLQAEERGEPLALSELLRTAPELETPLREFFRNRDGFDRLAGQLAPPATQPGMPPLPPDLPPGSRLGGYPILHEVGHGGRGVVYRVSDPELNRPLAIKVLRSELRADPDAVRRLLEEAQVTGQLQHPGIVPVHAVGLLPDGRPYFAMKLVQGRTLASLLAQRPAPGHDLPRFLEIFHLVCQAVAYAHSRGVIHRDLKPANVMVGAFGEVQVMDWGLAKVLSAEVPGRAASPSEPGEGGGETGDSVHTVRTEAAGLSSTAGLVVGTFPYMAPEQAKGWVERLDRRADVFGLGAVLCETLTGQPPYTAVTRGKLQMMAETGDLADAFGRLDRSGADAELIALAKDCLAPDRERRPGDAGAVAGRLAAYLAGVQERLRRAELEQAAAEARAGEARATARAERRARRLTAGLAVALLAAVGLVMGGGLWLQHQRAERQTEEARQAEALRRGVQAALEQAIRLRQAGHFAESREVLQHARERLGTDGPDDLCRQVDQALADTGLAKRLDAARQRALTELGGGKVDFAGAAKEYAAALKEAGLGREGEGAEVVAARVRASAVWAEVVAALDDWASIAGDGPRRAWLLAVARAADPDPRRNRLRRPELWRDRAALARVARQAPVAELSSQLVVALGRALFARSKDAIRLLREAQLQHPQDYWLTSGLALALHQAKKLDEAISFYRAALSLRPGPARHTSLGLTLYDAALVDLAIEQYDRALSLNPNYAPAHNNLAMALCAKDRLDQGIRHFKKAIRLDPTMAHYHFNLGKALETKGRTDEAVTQYREALSLDPKDVRALNNFGNTLQASGRLKEAIRNYRRAVAIDPDFASTYTNLGAALYRKGERAEAVKLFQKALDLGPTDDMAHNNLGKALHEQGRPDEAIKHFEKAIRLNPKNALPHFNLGLVLRKKGEWARALSEYRQALGLKKDYTDARLGLGNALYDMDRLDEAIRQYQKAIAIDPNLAPAHVLLGGALATVGRFAEACAATRRCRDLLRPGDPLRARAEDQLRLCQRWSLLEARLPAVFSGQYKPATAVEKVQFAWVCHATKHYAHAAELYTAAFAANPKPPPHSQPAHLYKAACSAVLAAAGVGADAPRTGDQERLRLRQQALDWLRAGLTLWEKQARPGNARACAVVRDVLWAWQNSPGLAGVRTKEGLAKLPDGERVAWEKFWADVRALRKRLRAPK
jgi:serine/threonine-protein kinase